MSEKYERYRLAASDIPESALAWNMYGAGLESIGRDDEPDQLPVPQPVDD